MDQSFIPRADAQVIIFSNDHLFDCIGKYDQKTKRRTVNFYEAMKMLSRFHIIKLDDEHESEIEDAVSHIDVCDAISLRQPFDVKFDRNGHPIDNDGNLTPYSLACKFDTRNNKSFNNMKKSILRRLEKSTSLSDYLTSSIQEPFETELPKTNNEYEHRFYNMCVDDMLKRYVDMHGRMNEFLECDSNFDFLDDFLKHQTSFQADYIFENRHILYECLATKNANALDIQGRVKKWYDPMVHQETLKIFDGSNPLIQDQQMQSFFEFVMREINNPDQSLVKKMGQEIMKSVSNKSTKSLYFKRKRNAFGEIV